MDLKDEQKASIEFSVSDIFYRLKMRLLGRFFTGPRIYFEIVDDLNPLDTLEGIYHYTASMMYGSTFRPSIKRIKNLNKITDNYIEAERLKTINNVIQAAQQGQSLDEIEQLIKETLDKSSKYIDMLVVTEARNVQSNAEREGVEKIAASIGVEDPNVCKVGVIDKKMCPVCRKLWHSEDNVYVPKVYKLSELQDGYNQSAKDPIATVLASHPRCRHVLTFIPPNFGFNDRGMIEFKGFGYDIYKEQRNS